VRAVKLIALLLPLFAAGEATAFVCESAEKLAEAVERASHTNPRGATRSAMYSSHWREADLDDVVERLIGKSARIETTETGKVIIRGEGHFQVVLDANGGYFRIQDLSRTGQRIYVDTDGNPLINRVVNGRTSGISRDEYAELTHFRAGGGMTHSVSTPPPAVTPTH
jgi:hypothetical protein